MRRRNDYDNLTLVFSLFVFVKKKENQKFALLTCTTEQTTFSVFSQQPQYMARVQASRIPGQSLILIKVRRINAWTH